MTVKKHLWYWTILVFLSMSSVCPAQSGSQNAGTNDSTRAFVTKLLAAQTEDERETLLSQDSELVTAELARALMGQGNASETQGAFANALRSYNLAKTIALRIDNKPILAQALLASGWSSFLQGDTIQALESMRKSLELREALGDKLGSAWVLNRIGNVYRTTAERKLAFEYQDRSLKLANELGDKRLLAEINLSLGLMHGPKESLSFFRNSLKFSEESGNKIGVANASVKVAAVLRDLGLIGEALEHSRAALRLAEEAGNQRIISFALDSLAEIYRIQGDYAQALEYFQRNLILNEKMGNHLGYTEALNKMGLVNFWQGEYVQALGYFQTALTRGRQVGNQRAIARAMSHIGQTYNRLGDYSHAMEYNLAAFALREQLGDKFGMADTAGNLGDLLWLQGKYTEALGYFHRSLKLAEEVGSKRDAAFALKGIALVHCNLRQYEQALESASRAIQLAKELGSREYLWSALTSAGRAHLSLGHLALARESLEEAILTIERLRSNVAGQQSRATYFANVQEPYERYIDLLMQMHKQRSSEGYDAVALHASERGRARSLLEVLAEVGANIREGVNPELLSRERYLQQQLNAVAERQARLLTDNETQEQPAALQKELESLTSELRNVAAQIRQHSPRYAALTQPEPLKLEEIQRQLLDANTALLEYALGEDRSYLWFVTPTSIKSFELPKRAELETSVRRVVELLNDGKRWSTDPQINLQYQDEATKLSRILIPPALLSQLKQKRLLVVGDGALQYLPFGVLPNLKSEGSSSQSINRQPLVADYEIVTLPSASKLALLRRENLSRRLPTNSVAVIADPVFEETDERVTTKSGMAAADTQNKNDEPFATSRALLQRAVEFETKPEAGTAVRDSLQIRRLPFTRFEAENILLNVPAHQSLKATDFRANRETATSVELSKYRFIHFATHAILNSEHPELSGIVLSLVTEEGKPVDGFLRLHDIYNLNLPADLVVLSACQTGLGREIRGEGLVGLTRGFMYAGTPRVVASLWKVDDAATAELMKRFYAAMLKDNLRPSAALRRAKIEMWKQKRWQAPYYWAAFELQGEWR